MDGEEGWKEVMLVWERENSAYWLQSESPLALKA